MAAATPTPYARSYSFSGYQAANPAVPLPGLKVDTEFDASGVVLNAVIAALADIRRADGKITNGAVTYDAMDATVAATITTNVKNALAAAGLITDVTIGTVTTLAAGAPATATLTGAAPNKVLNLGIPQGISGTLGASGTPTTGQLGIWTNATTLQGVLALPAANFPALTGHVTTVAGALGTTIANNVLTFAMFNSATIATAANYQAATASKILTADQAFAAAAPVAVTYGATITLDLNTGLNFDVAALTGNLTLANPTNAKPGQCGSIWLTQDGTGSRTITYGSNWKTAGGVAQALSTAANAQDRLDFIVKSATRIEYTLQKAIA